MTIGDVMAFVAIILAISLATWGCILGFAFLFPNRVQDARGEWTAHPYRTLIGGVLAGTALLTIAIAAFVAPPLIAKVFGACLGLYVLGQATLGVAGLAEEIAERMRESRSEISRYASIAASAKLLIFAMLIPVLGTFIVAPLLLGGGFWAGQFGKLAAKRKSVPAAAPPVAAGNPWQQP